jgi:hypothetical protein
MALILTGYFSPIPLSASSGNLEQKSAEQAILEAAAVLGSEGVDSRQRSLAFADYRRAVMRWLPLRKNKTVESLDKPKFFGPHDFLEVTPLEGGRVSANGLHREGLGLPVIGRMSQEEVENENRLPVAMES